MNLRWVQSPCKGCEERHLKCHATCQKYLKYREEFMSERERIYNEDRIDKAVNGMNYKGATKKEKASLPLRHGRKREKW